MTSSVTHKRLMDRTQLPFCRLKTQCGHAGLTVVTDDDQHLTVCNALSKLPARKLDQNHAVQLMMSKAHAGAHLISMAKPLQNLVNRLQYSNIPKLKQEAGYLRGVRSDSASWFACSPTKATVAAVPITEGPIKGPALPFVPTAAPSDKESKMWVLGSLRQHRLHETAIQLN